MYTFTYVCIYIYMYVCIHVYVYVPLGIYMTFSINGGAPKTDGFC